jgi:glutathione reductase (NADPH)
VVGKSESRCRGCGYKVDIAKRSKRILGAHLLEAAASETINVFALAMRFIIKADDLRSVLFAYPTFSAEIRRMV